MPAPRRPPPSAPFVWNQDAFWENLEREFAVARQQECPSDIAQRIFALSGNLAELRSAQALPSDLGWQSLETQFFSLAAQIGACPEKQGALVAYHQELRSSVKDLSVTWEPSDRTSDHIYRMLYGARMATEELLLQAPHRAPAWTKGRDEPSNTPSTMYRGVRIHSGDLLVSRGGAPTSAFISRGNDHPGNFSHVSIVHVHETSKKVSIIEAHIERGVAVSSAQDYFDDTKLRVLVLRPRADLPALVADPLLPHRAARHALEEQARRHIPYDFTMDAQEHSTQFCSEVASSAYEAQGVHLWSRESTLSAPGLVRWMTLLGVTHLSTHLPSDLEYDPRLRVVFEWHDAKVLFKDHVHNAIVDALLEAANEGAPFRYNHRLLPVARALKAYSWIANQWGGLGPIPEGMSATVALRSEWLKQCSDSLQEKALEKSQSFRRKNDYIPPYWVLVRFAQDSLQDSACN